MSNKPTVTYIIADLIDPLFILKDALNELPAQELPELPVFSLFLSRGRLKTSEVSEQNTDNYYSCLFKHLPLEKALSPLPIAAVSLLFDNRVADNTLADQRQSDEDLTNKWVMRLDPCFMVPDRDQLVLAKTGNLDLSLQEAEQLAEEIRQFYKQYEEEIFWTIKVLSPQRWYLISDKPITIDSVPPEKVIGQSVKSHLFSVSTGGNSAQAKENRYWLNLFNEFQMILHQSPVNKLRKQSNKIPVNSLWFWGQSRSFSAQDSIQESQSTQQRIYSDNTIAQALSFIQGGKYESLPERYISSDGLDSTYVIDDFSRALQKKDIFSWVGLIEQFEEEYLSPVLNDIHSGKIARLTIISPTGKTLLLTKKNLSRWWRRKRKFSRYFIEN